MLPISFPLDFKFKIFTPSNDFSVFDSQGNEIAYTRQKIFKIKEAIEIFRDKSAPTASLILMPATKSATSKAQI